MVDAAAGSVRKGTLGDELDLLLDQLSLAGLRIEPRDRTNVAALVADLVTRRQIESFEELRPWLAPLIARSTEDRERYFQIFDSLEPRPYVASPTTSIARRAEPQSRWSRLAPLALLLAAGILAWWYWPERAKEAAPNATVADQPTAIATPSNVATTQPQLSTASDTLNRIAAAAERFESAPTLYELGNELLGEFTIGWSGTGLAVRLSELSGLPAGSPLALYGADGPDGRIWAMIALALDRIERPGQESNFAELLIAANSSLTKNTAPVTRVYELAPKLGGWLSKNVPTDKSELISVVQQRYRADIVKHVGNPTPAEVLDEFTIQRALAIAPDARVRRTFSDAPWTPAHESNSAPDWAVWAAALVPLMLAVLWFANGLTFRKAYLRRRPPDLPPLHLDIVSETATRALRVSSLFRKVAQKLLLRTARPTSRLNLEASIAATITGGGELLRPVYESARRMPEYLVLIERRSAADQDAQRLRELVRHLEELIPINVFYYRTEPSRLEPERGGRSISIEQAQAAFPEHRLVILGSGAEFLEPGLLKPYVAVEKLTHWRERALLSPLPLAEWGREEFALAHELEMPIGRATPQGLRVLAELLGLEGNELDNFVDARGDGLARPLPATLRIRPQRLFYNSPPSALPVAQIVQDLRNFLDGPAFEWLCALAIYPAVQWDLTLYLGVMLPEKEDGDASTAPLYREDRVAALTQLPWLREGIMPNWLRKVLIRELSPKRTSEIRRLLRHLIDAAQVSGDARRDAAVTLRISHEAAKEQLLPHQLFDDEVLLDFLARGRIEDFALPQSRWLERIIPRQLLDRIGIPELTAGMVAAAYALAAYWLTPSATDGALVTGAWLPLITLVVGAVVALIVSYPASAFKLIREFLARSAPFALAYVAIMIAAYGLYLSNYALSAANPELAVVLGLICAVVLLWIARGVARAAGLPVLHSRKSTLYRILLDVGWSVVLLLLAGITWQLALTPNSPSDPTGGILDIRYAAIGGIVVVIASWILARFLPERLGRPRPVPRRSGPSWMGGAIRTSVALLPLLPAAWVGAYVAASSVRLPDVPGGVTAMAELPGGSLIALGGADGRVSIIDTRDRAGVPILSIRTSDAPVSDIALRASSDHDQNSPIVLAVATADGRIGLFDARDGSRQHLPQEFKDLGGGGSMTHVALGQGARPFVAIETKSGETKLVGYGVSTVATNIGPVTALTATIGDLFAVATLDGQVGLFKAMGESKPAFLQNDDTVRRLPDQGRNLTFDAATGLLTALGSDGNVLTARVGESGLREGKLDRKNEELALGPTIQWQKPASFRPKPDEPAEVSSTCEARQPEKPTSDVWDVLPIFYGTDREVELDPKRLVYNAERGRRLALGCALVTVPKSHDLRFIERPWAIRIPYLDVTIYEEDEDPDEHFSMKEMEALPRDEFLKAVRTRIAASSRFGGHALVFIHGYNTSFDHALYRTAQISYDLKFDGAAFFYSWPSGGALASYTYDRESAGQAQSYLREFLDLIVKQSGAKTISVIAHSMGNQPLLEALSIMKSAAPDDVLFSQLILAAPDVDADTFTNLARRIDGVAKGVTLYAASNDRALIVSRNFWQNPRAGDVPASGPLIVPGIDTIDVTAASRDTFAFKISAYAENKALLDDIGALIEKGLRPPDQRLERLKRITTEKGDYWRYTSAP